MDLTTGADSAPAPPRKQRKGAKGPYGPRPRMHPHCDCLIQKHKKTCPYRVPPVEPPVAPQRDGNGNEVVVVDDSDAEMSPVSPVTATTTSPADAFAGIKPYEEARDQMFAAAQKNETVAESKLDAQNAAVMKIDQGIKKNRAEIEQLKIRIAKDKNLLNVLQNNLDRDTRSLSREEKKRDAAEAKRDECRTERRRLEETEVPPPDVYSSFVPGTGISQGVKLSAKIDEVATTRAAGGGFYLGIVNSLERLKRRYKEHKGTLTNGGGPTMLALLSMGSAEETAEIERDVINYARNKNYQNQCQYQSDQDSKPMDLIEAWKCVNTNNGGNGVRTSKNHETQFYLYIFYTDKAHAS